MIAPASRKLGKYEIRQKLGRGGMADVYLAQDTATGQTLALKLIEHSADSDTRDAIAAEMRGAVLQERLAAVDPRVVRVYDAGDVDGFFFVAMEYVDGRDLAELMRHGPLDVEFAADVAPTASPREPCFWRCAPLRTLDSTQRTGSSSRVARWRPCSAGTDPRW